MIQLTSTITNKKELLKPLADKKIRLYVCGITPYSDSHLGHGRCYVAFDVLYRVLIFLGYEVIYCRNFTDIDDKLLVKSIERYGVQDRYLDIANECIAGYHADMKALGCSSPQIEPRVTEHISEIIALIERLIASGHAYAVAGDVYFSIPTFPDYPKLSKHNVNDLRAGARVEVNVDKKDPLDFALWKGEEDGEFWKSPWGWGRPGWHIECSALAAKYLGEHIDIHCGGQDLIFPHHDNEIAQSESAYGAPFANIWLHNGLIRINEEKMSKSLGNFFTLKDVFVDHDPMVVRFYFLNHHYRAPMEFSFDDLVMAKKTYQRLVRLFEGCQPHKISYERAQEIPIVARMLTFLTDDLNTVGMFGVLFEHFAEISQDMSVRSVVQYLLQDVLGLSLQPIKEKEVPLTPEIYALIEERKQARMQKDWARADALRDQLQELGVDVQDKKTS